MPLTEKYRPQNFSQVIGQDEIVTKILSILKRYKDSGELIPPLMFLGPAGCGKTTIAQCIARKLYGNQWERHYREMNASDARKIDDVRGTIKRIAQTRGSRILFLDESDNMTLDAQQALRRIMETTKSVIFILSGNREHKFIEPIKSRCVKFRFKRLTNNAVLQRILEICKGEGIKVTQQHHAALTMLVKDSKGDLRSAINNLEQLITAKKELTEANVIEMREVDLAKTSLNFALGGDFNRAREMIENAFIQTRYDASIVLDELYNAIGALDEKYNAISIRLFEKLAEIDYALKLGGNPVFQFVGFMAFAWICPYVPEACPALTRK